MSMGYPELQAVYILWKQNRVGVMVSGSDVAAGSDIELNKLSLPSELSRLLADPIIVVYPGQVRTQFTVIRGGDYWNAIRGLPYNCTIGFEVRDDFTGKWGMLTAGHCIEDLDLAIGAKVYHDTLLIGTVSGYVRNGATSSTSLGIDGAVIFSRSASTARDDIIHFGQIRDITGAAPEAQPGWFRCMTGATSGSVCGYVTCTHGTYQDSGNGRYYNNMLMIDLLVQGGDSGGPVYRTEGNESALVSGIVSGYVPPLTNCTNSNDTSASKWSNLSSFFHLTLVTK